MDRSGTDGIAKTQSTHIHCHAFPWVTQSLTSQLCVFSFECRGQNGMVGKISQTDWDIIIFGQIIAVGSSHLQWAFYATSGFLQLLCLWSTLTTHTPIGKPLTILILLRSHTVSLFFSSRMASWEYRCCKAFLFFVVCLLIFAI